MLQCFAPVFWLFRLHTYPNVYSTATQKDSKVSHDYLIHQRNLFHKIAPNIHIHNYLFRQEDCRQRYHLQYSDILLSWWNSNLYRISLYQDCTVLYHCHLYLHHRKADLKIFQCSAIRIGDFPHGLIVKLPKQEYFRPRLRIKLDNPISLPPLNHENHVCPLHLLLVQRLCRMLIQD